MFLEIALVVGLMVVLTAVASLITVVIIVLSEIKSDPNEHID
jgi:hypothetical protein